jgi:hypothetical protein
MSPDARASLSPRSTTSQEDLYDAEHPVDDFVVRETSLDGGEREPRQLITIAKTVMSAASSTLRRPD